MDRKMSNTRSGKMLSTIGIRLVFISSHLYNGSVYCPSILLMLLNHCRLQNKTGERTGQRVSSLEQSSNPESDIFYDKDFAVHSKSSEGTFLLSPCFVLHFSDLHEVWNNYVRLIAGVVPNISAGDSNYHTDGFDNNASTADSEGPEGNFIFTKFLLRIFRK